MQNGEPSRTAEYMALFRAMESTRPPGRRLFEDGFARGFLRPRLRVVADLARLPLVNGLVSAFIDHRWPGARTSGVARTRFIDDVIEATLGPRTEQVVILGAGFDTRAYRMAALTKVAVFEVDHPATSAAKQRLVEVATGGLPAHVRFVAVDFDTDQLPSSMSAAGFDPGRRTLFLWEGVTNYLSEDAVHATLRWCATAAAGSTVVFTYVDQRVLTAPETFEGTAELFATLRRSGERWTFGIDPSHLTDLLARCGLALDEDVGASEYRARYFGDAASGMRGYEFYRVAVAHVPPTTGRSIR